MPVPPLSNTFETALADATVITVANSDDGTAGDAFTTVSNSPTFSTAQAKSGTLAMRYDTTATYTQRYVDWQTLGSITGSVWLRFYMYSTAVPAGSFLRVVLFRTSAANCALLFVQTTTGVLQGANAAQAGGTSGTVAVALNQWVRIEMRVLPSTTAGEVEWWLYNDPEAAIGDFDDHVLITGQVLAANVDQVRLGGTTAAGPTSFVVWFDDVAVSSTGQIGPSEAVEGPQFVGAGSGVTIATGTSTVSKTACVEGDLMILQVYYDGTTGDWGIGSYVNLEDLTGSSGLTFVTTTPVGATANFSTFLGRATADGTCSVDLTVGASGEDLVCRLYEFSGVDDGATTADVLDNAEAAGNSGTSTTVAHAAHTTHGDNRLTFDLIGINAAQAITSFTGETGGDYTEAVAEYQGAGTVGTIGLQTASIPTANTLTGGTFTITSAAWGTWGASLVPFEVPVIEKQTFYASRRRSYR